MTTASNLSQRHFQTLVEDNAQWQTLITDDVVWQRPYAPAIGHPAQLSVGGGSASRHLVCRGRGKFSLLRSQGTCLTDPEAAVAEVKAEGLTKPTGRIYLQDYVLFLLAAGGLASTIRL